MASLHVNGLATLPRPKPLNDELYLLLLRKCGRGSWEQDLPRPNYYELDRGVELSAFTSARPCSPKLIKAVIEDLWIYTTLLILEFPIHMRGNFMNETLPDNIRLLVKYIGIVMNECRRLKRAPELFPSPGSRQQFLSQVAVLTTAMTAPEHTLKKTFLIRRKARMVLPYSSTLPEKSYTDSLEDRRIISAHLPHFYPDKLDGNNPWNNWLDNSALAERGWIAVQQKIPRIGDKMNRVKTLYFEALEAHFTDHGLVIRTEEDAVQKIGQPGDAYEHMTYSGFASVGNYNLGFNRGCRKPTDEDGIITLEELANSVRSLHEDQNIGLSQAFPDNCPYFRFVVAYQP